MFGELSKGQLFRNSQRLQKNKLFPYFGNLENFPNFGNSKEGLWLSTMEQGHKRGLALKTVWFNRVK
jgi:hypothetical protein